MRKLTVAEIIEGDLYQVFDNTGKMHFQGNIFDLMVFKSENNVQFVDYFNTISISNFKQLIALIHPDKHSGAKLATELTQKAIAMRWQFVDFVKQNLCEIEKLIECEVVID